MNKAISLLSTQSNITIWTILINLSLAFLTSLYILWLYRRTARSASYDPAYPSSLILITLITCQIMMTIGQNLALSLGLVGALSIVRFRMAIKDTLDLVFLFYAIAVGLAYGASAYTIGFLGALLSGLFLLFASGKTQWLRSRSGYLLHLKIETEEPIEWQQRFEQNLGELAKHVYMTAFSPLEDTNQFQYTYQISLQEQKQTSALIKIILESPGVISHQVFSAEEISV